MYKKGFTVRQSGLSKTMKFPMKIFRTLIAVSRVISGIFQMALALSLFFFAVSFFQTLRSTNQQTFRPTQEETFLKTSSICPFSFLYVSVHPKVA